MAHGIGAAGGETAIKHQAYNQRRKNIWRKWRRMANKRALE